MRTPAAPSVRTAPRKRSRLADQGRGRKSSAAVVAPSKQIKVADSELLTDWERKRQVGGRRGVHAAHAEHSLHTSWERY